MGNTAFCILRTADPDHQPEGLDLREEPEKGPRLAEPAAPRRHEEPRGSRRGLCGFTEQDFRRLCRVVRGELPAGLADGDLIEHLKDRCAALHLPYSSEVLQRVVDAVTAPRPAQPQLEIHWRQRCEALGHPRWCATPTQCALRAAREGR